MGIDMAGGADGWSCKPRAEPLSCFAVRCWRPSPPVLPGLVPCLQAAARPAAASGTAAVSSGGAGGGEHILRTRTYDLLITYDKHYAVGAVCELPCISVPLQVLGPSAQRACVLHAAACFAVQSAGAAAGLAGLLDVGLLPCECLPCSRRKHPCMSLMYCLPTATHRCPASG